MNNARRIALVGATVVVLVVAGIIAASLGGGSDFDKTATVTVKGGKPVGGIAKPKFEHGKTIDLTVKSDTADEVHFHGYDVGKDVKAGGTVHFRMPADIEGKFEVELENAGVQIAEVEVSQ